VRAEHDTSIHDGSFFRWDACLVDSAGASAPKSDASGSSAPEPLTALIADDSSSTRRFLRAVLEHSQRFGMIGEASDGDEAVERAKALQPDIVLLDLSMPLAYGTNALRRIRTVAPGTTVIVVSALDPALQMSTLEAGAVAFIPKGLTPFEFFESLRTIIDRSLNLRGRTGAKVTWTDPRAIVFADERVTRHLVSRVLDVCGAVVIAETNNSSTLLEVVDRVKAEIVVLGLSVKGAHNIQVVAEICTRSPNSAVVVYSAREKWRNKPLASEAITLVLRPRIGELVRKIEDIVQRRPSSLLQSACSPSS
jgi:DNA-binding NarL/FixJ family response regulator